MIGGIRNQQRVSYISNTSCDCIASNLAVLIDGGGDNLRRLNPCAMQTVNFLLMQLY